MFHLILLIVRILMKLVKLSDLFIIKYGNQFDLNKLTIDEKSHICFVSRTSKNNGVLNKVVQYNKVEPYQKGYITVSLGGSILSAFVQPYCFYTAQNIKVLMPKIFLTLKEKLFYCKAINHNKFRYSSHGREANKTLGSLMVPSLEEARKFIPKIKIKSPTYEPYHDKKISLHDREWKYFKCKDIFLIEGTKSHTKKQISLYGKGKYPYVVTSSENNGVQDFYNHSTEKANVLTVDSATVGSCFYQPYDFSASDHVEKLIPKFKMNAFNALFIKTIINLEKFRYSFGRKFAQIRIKQTKIKLPINDSGEPDWDFMENYIKSLPCSANLK